MLTPIDESTSGSLECRQLSGRPPQFELTSGSGVHGRLLWQASGNSLAIGEAANGTWAFERVGLLRHRITARHARTQADAATYWPLFGGGILEVEGGQAYVWARKGCWTSEWALRRANGRPLVRFSRTHGFLKLGARVEIGEAARSLDATSLLILMGWYLIVLDHEDTEMAAITTVLVGGAS